MHVVHIVGFAIVVGFGWFYLIAYLISARVTDLKQNRILQHGSLNRETQPVLISKNLVTPNSCPSCACSCILSGKPKWLGFWRIWQRSVQRSNLNSSRNLMNPMISSYRGFALHRVWDLRVCMTKFGRGFGYTLTADRLAFRAGRANQSIHWFLVGWLQPCLKEWVYRLFRLGHRLASPGFRVYWPHY